MSSDTMNYVLEPVEASIDVINVLFQTITTTMTDLQDFASSLPVAIAEGFQPCLAHWWYDRCLQQIIY